MKSVTLIEGGCFEDNLLLITYTVFLLLLVLYLVISKISVYNVLTMKFCLIACFVYVFILFLIIGVIGKTLWLCLFRGVDPKNILVLTSYIPVCLPLLLMNGFYGLSFIDTCVIWCNSFYDFVSKLRNWRNGHVVLFIIIFFGPPINITNRHLKEFSPHTSKSQ